MKNDNHGRPPPPAQYRWKPGQSGNPLGISQLDRELLDLRNLSKETYKNLINKIITGTEDEMQKIVLDPESTILERWIATICIRAAASGDSLALERLMNRVIGKVPIDIGLGANNKVGDFLMGVLSGDRRKDNPELK